MRQKKLLGEILLKAGIIDSSQLQKALDGSKKSGQRVGNILVKLGFSKEEDVLKAVASQLDIPYVKLSDIEIAPAVIAKIPVKFASRYTLIPVKITGDTLTVAMLDPLDIHTLDDLRLLLGCKVEVAISSEEEITKAVRKYYGVGAETMEKMVEEAEDEVDLESLEVGEEKNV